VKYTRTTDKALASTKLEDMKKRLNIINDKNNLLFLSLHVNSYPSAICHGGQVFYNKKISNNILLASLIQQMLSRFDKTNKREAKTISGKYLIDEAKIPGLIIELGFLTSPLDLAYLTDDIKLYGIVNYIYLGVISYLENNYI
jgi:N-acetylmuramoyl-L-alanine amidase